MEAIQQHIDFLFQDLPDTKEIVRIKNDLYLNAVDRFEELRFEGKTESEALGTIIIEMGDREELLQDFQYDQESDLKAYSTNTLSEAKYLLSTHRSEAKKIGFGILLILLGAGLMPTFITFDNPFVGVMLLLFLVAIAVGMFIISGLKLTSVEESIKRMNITFYLTDEDYEVVENQYFQFKDTNRFRIPLGVMLCIVAVIPIVFFSFLENDLLIQRYGVLLLMLAIGIGIYQFVQYGMNVSAYEKILNIGEYSEEEIAFQQKLEPIGGIYWMLMTIVYLTWSFLTMNWHVTWIIWPIVGVVWALIVLILKMTSNYTQN